MRFNIITNGVDWDFIFITINYVTTIQNFIIKS